MPTVLEFMLGVCATWQTVETVHHGSIFEWLRQWAAAQQSSDRKELRLLGDLIACPFCLSHWVGAVVALFLFVASNDAAWFVLPVWWLATVRGAQLLNDMTHGLCRSPKDDNEDESVSMIL